MRVTILGSFLCLLCVHCFESRCVSNNLMSKSLFFLKQHISTSKIKFTIMKPIPANPSHITLAYYFPALILKSNPISNLGDHERTGYYFMQLKATKYLLRFHVRAGSGCARGASAFR